ncbi:MAG TPA: hypothetical protein VM430_13485 [Microbacterium sp.]|nr:hypothetical protein [Microbacterium sp.]
MNFDCENICTKRCAGPCQGRPTKPASPLLLASVGLAGCILALTLFFLAVWAVAHAAGLDRGR